MIRKILALGIFILFVGHLFAQKSALLDHTINKANTIHSKKALQVFLAQQFLSHDRISEDQAEIVDKVLLAKVQLFEQDSINAESTRLFAEAVEMAQKRGEQPLLVWAATNAGFYYYSYSNYQKAFPLFMMSSKLLDAHTADFSYESAETLKKNAYFFATTKDNDRAINYYKMALTQIDSAHWEYGAVLNGIGHCYADMNEQAQAETYFEKTRDVAKANGDVVRYAKALGDLATLYMNQGQLDRALPLFMEDIRLSEISKSDRNTMWAKIQLSKLFLKKGDWKSAQAYVTEAEQYARTKTYLKGYESEIGNIRLEIAVATGNTREELFARRLLDSLHDIVANSDGLKAVEKINYETQKERIIWQLEAEQAKLEKAIWRSWAYVLIGLLLLAIFFSVFVVYRRRVQFEISEYKSKVDLFQIEKDQSEKKLSAARNSLDSYKVYLNEKNSQIKALLSTLKEIRNAPEGISEHEKGQLEKLLESHLMTEENWQQFKKAFILEQGEYYEYIIQNFPNLTESNLRIIFLQKIGLTNPEMAQILGISLDGIKKAKQRLRKKYVGLSDNDLILN